MSQKKQKRLRRQEKKLEEQQNEVEDVGWRKIITENIGAIGIILAVAIGLYINALGGDFVSDDYATITQDPFVTNFGYMSRYLINGLCNWFIAVVFGVGSPLPFHVFSLGLYLTSCFLGYVFLYLITDKRTALISMLIFAALPVHVEAVSWISGKPYLLNAVGVLLSLNLAILYLKSQRKKYLYWFVASLPVAFMAERVRFFALFFVGGIYFVSLGKKYVPKINWGKLGKGLAVLALFGAVILPPMVKDRITSVNSGYNNSGSIFYNPLFQYPTAMPKYLQLLWFPADLTLYHTMYVLPNWLNWAIFLLFLTNLGYFYFKDKRLFFALGFIFAAAAPSMAPVKVSWLVAERYMFLGSLGFSLLLGIILCEIYKRSKVTAVSLLVVLMGSYGARVVMRNIDWSTNHKLWVNTVQVSPNSHNAWNNIGDDYDKLQDYENAVKSFSQSTVVKTNYADAYHNRANILYKMGRLDLARDSYNTALQYSPGLFQTYFSLTQLDLMEGRGDLARQHAQAAIELQPENPQAYYLAGIVEARIGNSEGAKQLLELALKIAPNFGPARDALNKLSTQ